MGLHGRSRVVTIIVFVAFITTVVGCDGSSSPPSTEPPATQPPATQLPATQSQSALLSLINTANQNQAPPSSLRLLDEQTYAELRQEIANLATPAGRVANQFISVGWRNVTADVLDRFAYYGCYNSPSVAANYLLSYVPKPHFKSLPALMQALYLIPAKCKITHPEALDELTNLVVGRVLAVERQDNQPLPAPSDRAVVNQPEKVNKKYQAVCAAATVGGEAWAAKVGEANKGKGLVIGMVIAAGAIFCHDVLRSFLGG